MANGTIHINVQRNVPLRVYLAGRIARDRTRWGLVTISKADADEYLNAEPIPFECGGKRYEYTGPFTVGCDHGCAHAFDHAVGPTCGDDEFSYMIGDTLRDDLRSAVYRKSQTGIKDADVVFAWLGGDANQAHGTLIEIGIAAGLHKPVIVGCLPKSNPGSRNAPWFAKEAAWLVVTADDPKTAFCLAMAEYERIRIPPWRKATP